MYLKCVFEYAKFAWRNEGVQHQPTPHFPEVSLGFGQVLPSTMGHTHSTCRYPIFEQTKAIFSYWPSAAPLMASSENHFWDAPHVPTCEVRPEYHGGRLSQTTNLRWASAPLLSFHTLLAQVTADVECDAGMSATSRVNDDQWCHFRLDKRERCKTVSSSELTFEVANRRHTYACTHPKLSKRMFQAKHKGSEAVTVI